MTTQTTTGRYLVDLAVKHLPMCVSVCPCGPGTWTLICRSGCGIHFRQNECRHGRSFGSQSRLWRLCLHTAHVSSKLMGVDAGVVVGAAEGGDISVVCSAAASPTWGVSVAAGSALVLLEPAGLTALLPLPLTSPPAPTTAPLLTSPLSLVSVALSVDTISSPSFGSVSMIIIGFLSVVCDWSFSCAEGTESELANDSKSS